MSKELFIKFGTARAVVADIYEYSDITDDTTIGEIKDRISRGEGKTATMTGPGTIERHKIRLIYAGRALGDDETIGNIVNGGLPSGSTLYLVPKSVWTNKGGSGRRLRRRKRQTKRRGGVHPRRRRRTLKRSKSLPSSFRPHYTSYLPPTQPLVEEPPLPPPVRLTRASTASTANRGGRKHRRRRKRRTKRRRRRRQHRQKRRNQKGGTLGLVPGPNNTFRIGGETNGVGMFELAAVFTLLGLRQGAQSATAVGNTLHRSAARKGKTDEVVKNLRRAAVAADEAVINRNLNIALQWIQDEVRTAAGPRPRWRGAVEAGVVPAVARQAAMRSFGVGAGGGSGATMEARKAEVLFVPVAFEVGFTGEAAGAAGGAAGGAADNNIGAMTPARLWVGQNVPRINERGTNKGRSGAVSTAIRDILREQIGRSTRDTDFVQAIRAVGQARRAARDRAILAGKPADGSHQRQIVRTEAWAAFWERVGEEMRDEQARKVAEAEGKAAEAEGKAAAEAEAQARRREEEEERRVAAALEELGWEAFIDQEEAREDDEGGEDGGAQGGGEGHMPSGGGYRKTRRRKRRRTRKHRRRRKRKTRRKRRRRRTRRH